MMKVHHSSAITRCMASPAGCGRGAINKMVRPTCVVGERLTADALNALTSPCRVVRRGIFIAQRGFCRLIAAVLDTRVRLNSLPKSASSRHVDRSCTEPGERSQRQRYIWNTSDRTLSSVSRRFTRQRPRGKTPEPGLNAMLSADCSLIIAHSRAFPVLIFTLRTFDPAEPKSTPVFDDHIPGFTRGCRISKIVQTDR